MSLTSFTGRKLLSNASLMVIESKFIKITQKYTFSRGNFSLIGMFALYSLQKLKLFSFVSPNMILNIYTYVKLNCLKPLTI